MSVDAEKKERTVSAAVVLAVCSLMVSIGIGGFFFARKEAAPAAEPPPQQLHARRDTTSSATIAESFLDGWRKRDHATTLALSVEQAHVEAAGRRDAEAALDDEALVVQQRLWPRIANTRLRVTVERTTARGEGRTYLEGRAVGTFLDKPYERRIAFEMLETQAGPRVARMDLGTIERGAELVRQEEDPSGAQ